MKLIHLKIACYLYNQFTDYDDSYLNLLEKYQFLDLNDKVQIKALIESLRSWGCRQFKNDSEEISVNNFYEWYTSRSSMLPARNIHLIDYDLPRNKVLIAELFDDLSGRIASIRYKKTKEIKVSIGAVGTAKTLFALRPNLFAPWDTPIYNKLKLTGNGTGYVAYLLKIQNELRELRSGLNDSEMSWDGLFEYLEKRHNSYPKLIDEYFWITITKRCEPIKIESFVKNEIAHNSIFGA